MKCRDILCSLAEVDTNCIMAFGHSRGAYATTGLVAMNPGKFSCAGHTAGGAIPLTGYSAPSTALAAQVTCPYIMHHGDSDTVVPAFYDSTLNAVFDSTGIAHQLYIYPGLNHPQMSMDSLMLVRTHDWFQNHSCINSEINEPEKTIEPQVYFFPGENSLKIIFDVSDFTATLYDLRGQMISTLTSKSGTAIHSQDCKPGFYMLIITSDEKCFVKKLVVR